MSEMTNQPKPIAECLADLSPEELSAYAHGHDGAAAQFTRLGRHGEANWQKAIAMVLAVALGERAGEPSMYEIDDPDLYLATVARELDDVSLNGAVLTFTVAYTLNRDTWSPTVAATLLALNTPLLEEWQRRTPQPVA